MRTYTVYLSSNQSVGIPGLADSQSLTAVPSVTADGGAFGSTPSYTAQYNDGSFFPWKYVIQTFTTNLPTVNLKGPYTITFSTSGLDSSLFGILKVLYNFGDGTNRVVNYPAGNSYTGIALIERPGDVNVSNSYYPQSSGSTTYTPSITVVNGNLVSFVYNLTANVYPASIYDLTDIHLLDSISVGVSSSKLFSIYETRSPNYITHALALSA